MESTTLKFTIINNFAIDLTITPFKKEDSPSIVAKVSELSLVLLDHKGAFDTVTFPINNSKKVALVKTIKKDENLDLEMKTSLEQIFKNSNKYAVTFYQKDISFSRK